MDSLLHPVGPEPAAVYWTRRAVVILGALLLISLLVAIFWPRDANTASGPATAVPSVDRPSTMPAGTPTAAASTGGTATRSSSAPASSPASSTTPSGPVACVAGDLRVKLDGSAKPRAGKKSVFTTTITNASKLTCILDVTSDDFDLTITSGMDRIWTTQHCAAWVPEKKVKLAPGKKHVIKQTWPGRRSADGCKVRKDVTLRSGTYVATATFEGAAPGRLVMTVRG